MQDRRRHGVCAKGHEIRELALVARDQRVSPVVLLPNLELIGAAWLYRAATEGSEVDRHVGRSRYADNLTVLIRNQNVTSPPHPRGLRVGDDDRADADSIGVSGSECSDCRKRVLIT